MAFKRSAVRSRLSPPGKRKALEVSFQGFSFRSWSYPSFGPVAQLGERSVRIREVESSNLFRSTRRTLDGHLLFQKRLCRDGAALMSKRTAEVKVWKPWPPLFYRSIPFCPVLPLPDRRRPPICPMRAPGYPHDTGPSPLAGGGEAAGPPGSDRASQIRQRCVPRDGRSGPGGAGHIPSRTGNAVYHPPVTDAAGRGGRTAGAG